MENSKNDDQNVEKMHIAFPQSDQDKRLQLVDINGSIFAIVFAPLDSNGPIKLDCKDWSLILLSPIKSNVDVEISAINILCFSDIETKEGTLTLHASNLLVKFAPYITPTEKINEIGERGNYNFSDDPNALLQYYRIFETILSSIREGKASDDALHEAQQKFILGLCSIATKIEKENPDLNLAKVLNLWEISNKGEPKS